MLSKGFDIKFVSEQTGHQSIAITLEVYHHILTEVQEKNAKKLYNL